jgi:hypothetical protein
MNKLHIRGPRQQRAIQALLDGAISVQDWVQK